MSPVIIQIAIWARSMTKIYIEIWLATTQVKYSPIYRRGVGIWRYLFKYLEKVALMDWKTEFEQFEDQRARPYE